MPVSLLHHFQLLVLSDRCTHGEVQYQVCNFLNVYFKENAYLVLNLSMNTFVRQGTTIN